MIRKATEQDITGIRHLAEVSLHQTMAATHLENPAYVDRVLERVYSEEALRRSISTGGTTLLVAEQDGQIVGLCQFGSPLMDECEDRKEIHRLLIHPDYCRQGIGTRFVEAVEDELSEDVGIARISVYVNPADTGRIRFYAALDFYHEMTEDKDGEWYMELELD
jgi:ribosomal protein S18 acetylase RimI-like enzyme